MCTCMCMFVCPQAPWSYREVRAWLEQQSTRARVASSADMYVHVPFVSCPRASELNLCVCACVCTLCQVLRAPTCLCVTHAIYTYICVCMCVCVCVCVCVFASAHFFSLTTYQSRVLHVSCVCVYVCLYGCVCMCSVIVCVV